MKKVVSHVGACAQVEAVPTRRLNVMRSAAASPVTTDAAGIAVVRKLLRMPDTPR